MSYFSLLFFLFFFYKKENRSMEQVLLGGRGMISVEEGEVTRKESRTVKNVYKHM
jgi:hypothetical protein